jgi:hypothetical protein
MFHTQSQSNRSVIDETFTEPGTAPDKPMKFEVPTVRIKTEKPDADETPAERHNKRSSASSSRGKKAAETITLDLDEDGPSGSKRRCETSTIKTEILETSTTAITEKLDTNIIKTEILETSAKSAILETGINSKTVKVEGNFKTEKHDNS